MAMAKARRDYQSKYAYGFLGTSSGGSLIKYVFWFVVVLLGLAILGIGFYEIYYWIMGKFPDAYNRAVKSYKPDESKTTVSLLILQANTELLYSAMKSGVIPGTDEEAIFAVFDRKNVEDCNAINHYFGIRNYTDGLFQNEPWNLSQWLKEELSDDKSELERCRKLVSGSMIII